MEKYQVIISKERFEELLEIEKVKIPKFEELEEQADKHFIEQWKNINTHAEKILRSNSFLKRFKMLFLK